MQNTLPKTTNFVQLLSLSGFSLATLFSANIHAAIPVESRPLSSPTTLSVRTDNDQTSQLWQLTQQVQKLQEEVRQLRGKVESHDNDIDQVQKETKNRYVDFDQRLGQVQEDLKKSQAGAMPPTSTDSVTPADHSAGNTLSNQPAPISDEADKFAYIAAYEAYKAGGAAQAIAPMKKFIADYPKSPFVPNAYYWLGEFNLAITPPNFAAASSNFKLVMNQYPKTAKAAAATYRVATLADVDRQQATAVALMQSLVKNYPGTQEAGYAADYLKSHAARNVIKQPETKKVEASKVQKPVVKKTEKTDIKKTEITEKPKTKPVPKVKTTDKTRGDI